MYARHFIFRSLPERRPQIETMADNIFAYTRSLPGFVNAHYGVSEDETRYVSFSVWASRHDAEHAGAAIQERFAETLGGLATAPPEMTIFEVYEPRS